MSTDVEVNQERAETAREKAKKVMKQFDEHPGLFEAIFTPAEEPEDDPPDEDLIEALRPWLRSDVDLPPWARQPGETSAAYGNFLAYLRLPPHHRFVWAAAAAVEKTTSALEKQASRYHWSARATAYDMAVVERRIRIEAAGQARVRTGLSDHTQALAQMTDLAIEAQFERDESGRAVGLVERPRVGDMLKLIDRSQASVEALLDAPDPEAVLRLISMAAWDAALAVDEALVDAAEWFDVGDQMTPDEVQLHWRVARQRIRYDLKRKLEHLSLRWRNDVSREFSYPSLRMPADVRGIWGQDDEDDLD